MKCPKIFTSHLGEAKYALALNEMQFKKLKRSLEIDDRNASFLDGGNHVGQVTYWNHGGKQIVQIGNTDGLDPIEVVGTFVHESTHVFQGICNYIGEDHPSKEFEAYSIQKITEDLLRSHQELTANHDD